MSSPNRTAISPISIPVVCPLSIHQAVIEVLEILILKLQQKHNKEWPQVTETIKVKIKTIGMNTGGAQAWFCVRVKCSGLEIADVDLAPLLPTNKNGLTHLVHTMQNIFPGEFLWQETSYPEKGTREFLWLRLKKNNGETISRSEFRKTGLGEKTNRELSICWKVVQSREHMVAESESVCSYLHRLKLLTPQANIHFFLTVWGVISSSKFEWNSHKITLRQRKVAGDIQHYLPKEEIPENVNKISVKRGTEYTIPGIHVGRSDVTCKISATAAILPPPDDDELCTKELNTKCNKLKMLFYGPGGFPLVLPGSRQSGICPSTVFKMSDYGLTLGDVIHERGGDQEEVTADWFYHIRASEEEWQDTLLEWDESSVNDNSKTSYTILIIITIDPMNQAESSKDFVKSLMLLDRVRHSFVGMLCTYRTKVRRAVGTAMDKLLLNSSKEDHQQLQMEKAISTISSCITDIVSRSFNVPFQENCFTLFNTDNIQDFKASINSNLWEIAKEKHGVTCQSETQKKSRKRTASAKLKTKAKKKPDVFDELASAALEDENVCPEAQNELQISSTPDNNARSNSEAARPGPTDLSPFSDLTFAANLEVSTANETQPSTSKAYKTGDQQLEEFLNSLDQEIPGNVSVTEELIANLEAQNQAKHFNFNDWTTPTQSVNPNSLHTTSNTGGLDLTFGSFDLSSTSNCLENREQTHGKRDLVLPEGPATGDNFEEWLQNFSWDK